MGKIEDLKETAPCGMLIHYTVDGDDIIVYNDINGRGVQCEHCKNCSWHNICKPEPKKEPEKKMTLQTYIEIYDLIDDAMQEAGARVETACNRLVELDADPKSVLACEMLEAIKRNQKKYNEMKKLLERFEEEVEEPTE